MGARPGARVLTGRLLTRATDLFPLWVVAGGIVGVLHPPAVAIEVGMQNSGLAVVLARLHFANPLTALPGALSAIVHCVMGSAPAAWWRRRP